MTRGILNEILCFTGLSFFMIIPVAMLSPGCDRSQDEQNTVFESYQDPTREREIRHRKFDKSIHRNSVNYRRGIDSEPGEADVDTDKRVDDRNSPNYLRNQPDNYKTD